MNGDDARESTQHQGRKRTWMNAVCEILIFLSLAGRGAMNNLATFVIFDLSSIEPCSLLFLRFVSRIHKNMKSEKVET